MNLISQIPGSSGDRYVLVGAHYDSIPRTGNAPGAEDNASGVATLLSIAKLLKAKGTPNRSIKFVMFTAEEEGLLGSEVFRRTCKRGETGQVRWQHHSRRSILHEEQGQRASHLRDVRREDGDRSDHRQPR